ncbi:MAG: ABC transporter ATP-binding protein/permease, partial [Planctomycetes bacterium]|nr:ABC transporter ATP-binding protein/permease [Planctomycetota bacterium]
VILGAVVDNAVTLSVVFTSLGIMLVSIAGSAVMRNFSIIRQTVGGYTMCAEKRIDIGERLKYMPMGYFSDNNLGRIASITTNTAENLQDVATRVIQMYLQGVINTVVFILALGVFNIRVGLVAAAGMGLFFLVNAILQQVSKRISPRKTEADETIVDAVLEYVQGIGVVKSYNLTDRADSKIENAITECEQVNFNLEKKFVPLHGLQTVVLKLAGVAMAGTAIGLHLRGLFPLVDCLLMIICSFMVFAALETAGLYSALLRIVDLSVRRMEEIFETPVMDGDGRDVRPDHFAIEGREVTFSYNSRKIIDKVSYRIGAGTTTAIVGPSGSGKTTLCNLMARFWDVDDGAILVGGRDVREYKLDNLLGSVSMVFQNVYLFNASIANNIAFGRPGATREQVVEAAKKACCHEFVSALPDGYDTVVGEGGATLSGGERQRISIARAILKDAPIVFLDETTANVDPENEQQLQTAIGELTRDKTIVMIAHRLKTVRHADQTLVLDKGKIVQRGTHDELIRQGGLYATFVRRREQAVGWKLGSGEAMTYCLPILAEHSAG